jgi:hypothetical protein
MDGLPILVIPAKAGIQEIYASLDSRLRGNDVREAFSYNPHAASDISYPSSSIPHPEHPTNISHPVSRIPYPTSNIPHPASRIPPYRG